MKIYIDSREKDPWDFDEHETETVTIDTGDYTVDGNAGVIERKTADDFLKSITWERDRFEDECRRADELSELVVLVEKQWSYFENENYRQDVSSNSIEATVEAWERQYNVQFEFEANRWAAESRAVEILESWDSETV